MNDTIAELTALEAKATKGPWKADCDDDGDCVVWGPGVDNFLCNVGSTVQPIPQEQVVFDLDKANAALIVTMRNALPELLAELENAPVYQKVLLDEIKALTEARNDLAESYERTTHERNAALARAEKAEAERDVLAKECAEFQEVIDCDARNDEHDYRYWLEWAAREAAKRESSEV